MRKSQELLASLLDDSLENETPATPPEAVEDAAPPVHPATPKPVVAGKTVPTLVLPVREDKRRESLDSATDSAVDWTPKPQQSPGDRVSPWVWVFGAALLVLGTALVMRVFDAGGGGSVGPDLDREHAKAARRIESAVRELMLDMAVHHGETADMLRDEEEGLATAGDWVSRDQEFNNQAFSRFITNTGLVEQDFLPASEGAAVGPEHAQYADAVSEGFMRIAR